MHRILTAFITAGLLALLLSFTAAAQIGGEATYKFLNITNSARVAALGGNVLAIKDNDVTLTLTNPSLISPEMNNNLALSYVNYFTGNNFGFIMYSRTFEKAGSFVGALQFMNYGKFTEADEAGNITGEFSASEYAFNIGWGRKLNPNFSVGANGKLIYSSLDIYKSFGLAVDIAGTYMTQNELFTASLLARNIGSQIVPYISGTIRTAAVRASDRPVAEIQTYPVPGSHASHEPHPVGPFLYRSDRSQQPVGSPYRAGRRENWF